MFTELSTNLNNHQSLTNRPNAIEGMTPEQLKILYDKAANDIKTFINDVLLAELESITAGTSGTENIGSAPIAGISGTTAYDQLVSLKDAIDNIIAGEFPDGSITESMLDFAVATQTELDAVTTAYQAADVSIKIRQYMGV